jgi:glutathione S-transferase
MIVNVPVTTLSHIVKMQLSSSNKSEKLRVFVDLMSQPSRSVLLLCLLTNTPHERVVTSISKGENITTEYLKINPIGKVPAILDTDNFALFESPSIMRYLCTTKPATIPSHWFPHNSPKQAAIINSAMDWFLNNLRIASRTVVFHRCIAILLNKPPNEALVLSPLGLPYLISSLHTLETVLLPTKDTYIGGMSQPSIADLLIGCEVEQLTLLDAALKGPTLQELLAPHPNIRHWLDIKLRRDLDPQWNEVHKVLRQAKKRLMTVRENAMSSGAVAAAFSKY